MTMKPSPFAGLDASDRARRENDRWHVMQPIDPNPPEVVTQADRDAEFLSDLADRIFRNATPAMGFDQGDVDQLYRIARHRLRHTPDREAMALSQAVRMILARCEALEDEAHNGIAAAIANSRSETHEAGFWRGQKSTAKSIRNHLHDMTRQSIAMIEGGGAL